jgi:curved DNA-binding protein CbpA
MGKDEIIDFYELLEVSPSASKKELTKAYRTAALKWHPDKNPGVDTSEKFDQIKKAYNALSDPVQRAELDKHLKAKIARKKVEEAMDAGRRSMKQKLREREEAAETNAASSKRRKFDIDRIREQNIARQQQYETARRAAASAVRTKKTDPIIPEQEGPGLRLRTVKAKWNSKVSPLYTEKSLTTECMSFGEVALVKISKKGRSGIIEFSSDEAASAAVGSRHKDLRFSFLKTSGQKLEASNLPNLEANYAAPSPTPGNLGSQSHEDLEAQVLRQMMAAMAAQQEHTAE